MKCLCRESLVTMKFFRKYALICLRYDALTMIDGIWEYYDNSTFLTYVCQIESFKYTDWADWGSCTVDCGSGWKTR